MAKSNLKIKGDYENLSDNFNSNSNFLNSNKRVVDVVVIIDQFGHF